MPIFDKCFYREGTRLKPQPDHGMYRVALEDALAHCATHHDRERILKREVVEITRHVTQGIRDLVTRNRRIRRLVLDEGAVPLATWAEMLDVLAEHSMPGLRRKIAEMRHELEQGRIQGFPGTMMLYGKPSFAYLQGFYEVVFSTAEARSA